jgi:hypothetical protein
MGKCSLQEAISFGCCCCSFCGQGRRKEEEEEEEGDFPFGGRDANDFDTPIKGGRIGRRGGGVREGEG